MLDRVINNLRAYENWARGVDFSQLNKMLKGEGYYYLVTIPGAIPGKDLQWWEHQLIVHGALDLIMRQVYDERFTAGERVATPPPANLG